MRPPSPLSRALATCALVLAACAPGDVSGSELSRREPADTPLDLASLLPEDVVGFVQYESLDSLLALATRLEAVTATGPDEAGDAGEADQGGDGRGTRPPTAAELLVDDLLAVRGDPELLDRARPLGVAFVLPRAGRPPSPITIVPAPDPAAFVASVPADPALPPPVILGDYVALPTERPFRPRGAPHAFAARMPRGDVSVRLDLARLFVSRRSDVEDALDAAVQLAVSPCAGNGEAARGLQSLVEACSDGARDLLDAATRLDLTLTAAGPELELTAALTLLPGSALAEVAAGAPPRASDELRALARLVDPDAPLLLLAQLDATARGARVRALADRALVAWPTPVRASCAVWLERVSGGNPLCGPAVATEGDWQGGGPRLRSFLSPPEADAFLRRYGELLEDAAPGLVVERVEDPAVPPTGELADVELASFRVRADLEGLALRGDEADAAEAERLALAQQRLEALGGADGLPLHVAVSGARAVLVAGGDEAWLCDSLERLCAAGRVLPARLRRAVDLVADAHPAFVLRVDPLRLRERWEGAEPASPEGAPVLLFGAVDGDTWRAGLTVDLGHLRALIAADAH